MSVPDETRQLLAAVQALLAQVEGRAEDRLTRLLQPLPAPLADELAAPLQQLYFLAGFDPYDGMAQTVTADAAAHSAPGRRRAQRGDAPPPASTNSATHGDGAAAVRPSTRRGLTAPPPDTAPSTPRSPPTAPRAAAANLEPPEPLSGGAVPEAGPGEPRREAPPPLPGRDTAGTQTHADRAPLQTASTASTLSQLRRNIRRGARPAAAESQRQNAATSHTAGEGPGAAARARPTIANDLRAPTSTGSAAVEPAAPADHKRRRFEPEDSARDSRRNARNPTVDPAAGSSRGTATSPIEPISARSVNAQEQPVSQDRAPGGAGEAGSVSGSGSGSDDIVDSLPRQLADAARRHGVDQT